MKIKIIVPYESKRRYIRFCYLLLPHIKRDMAIRLSKKKLDIRKEYLDKYLSNKLDYYFIYKKAIDMMYLRWDEENEYLSIVFDDSVRVRGVKVEMVLRMIEFGVGEIPPYPFIRTSAMKYSRILEQVYNNYCKEDKVDLLIRRSNNRRPQVSARR